MANIVVADTTTNASRSLVQPVGDSSQSAIESAAHAGVGRPLWGSVLFSLVLHLVLALLLSLIVFGGGSGAREQALVFDTPAPEPQLIDAMSFELAPATPAAEFVEPVTAEPVELVAPVAISDLPRVEPAEVGPADPEPVVRAAAGEASALSPAAARIQKRVSEAGGKKGEVQFALAWRNVNDVDLHVIAPAGERISHRRKRSTDGGRLDVDMNVRGESTEPVENVRWIQGAPWGRYTVLVNLFRIHRAGGSGRSSSRSTFQLLAHLGDETTLENGSVHRSNQLAVFRFRYIPKTLAAAERTRLLDELARLQETEEQRASVALTQAKEIKSSPLRDQMLNRLIMQYPHTDSAIAAMRLLGGQITKAGSL